MSRVGGDLVPPGPGQAEIDAKDGLQRLIDADIVGVVVASPSGGVAQANDYYLRTIGYTRAEFDQGLVNWRAITPPEWLPADENAIRELEALGTCTPYEKEYLRRDGTRVSVLLHDALLPGPEKNIVAFVLDITERKRAEDALLALTWRQEAILAASPDIIAEVDADKVYTWMNWAGLEFFGGDALGKRADHFFEGSQETYTTVQPLFNGDPNVIYVESWQRRSDGEARLLAWWCRVLKGADGNVTGALSTARDVTESRRAEDILRQAEQRYRLLYDRSPDGIVIIDPATGHLLQFNETAHRQLGYTRDEFALLCISDLEAAETPEEIRERIASVHRQCRADFDTRQRTKQGEIRDVQVTAQFTETMGRPLYHCVWRDVTERKRAEERIRSQLDELQRWQEVMLDREDRVQQIKREVNELCRRVGEAVRYPSQDGTTAGADTPDPAGPT